MLTVTAASTSDLMTTLGAVKTALSITTTADDERLEAAISAASHAVAKYLGYYPLRQTYRETVPGYGDLTLMLSRIPVTTVDGLYYGSTMEIVAPTSYTLDNAEAGFIMRDLGFPWSAGVEWDMESHIMPRSERNQFIVDYQAGFIYSTDTARTLPYDLEQAVIITAGAVYYAAQRDPGIASKSVGQLSVSYRDTMSAQRGPIPDTAAALLIPYRINK
jgi:hypothetical protein